MRRLTSGLSASYGNARNDLSIQNTRMVFVFATCLFFQDFDIRKLRRSDVVSFFWRYCLNVHLCV